MTSSKYLILIILALCTVLSCTEKDGGGAVSISLDPLELNAPYTRSDQTFELQSNGDWTVKVESIEGLPIAWAKVNREKGRGNANVSIRVNQNDYSDERVAKVIVTSATGETAVLTLTQSGNPGSSAALNELTLRIGTYNLRVTTSKDTGEYAWVNRRTRLIKSIYDNDFDVFGVNECNKEIQSYINENLKNDYNIKYFSPYSQDGVGDNAQGLVYKKGYTLLDWNYFWLSETPDIMVDNDKSGDSVYKRGGCCATLIHNDSGVKFFVMVTHGAVNKSVRDKYAYLYIEMEKKYNPDAYPSFFVGDMNARPDQNSTKTYLTYWKDVYLELDESQKSGPFCTFNGFDNSINLNNDPRRIDYVYYRNATPLNYVCNDTKYGDYFASDHLPVYSDMKILSMIE